MQSSNVVRKPTSFHPSIRVTLLQAVIIIITLSVIAAVPVAIQKFILGDNGSQQETFEAAENSSSEEFILKLPVTGTDINLTSMKENPKILTYTGLALVSVAILVGLSLAKNALGKKSRSQTQNSIQPSPY